MDCVLKNGTQIIDMNEIATTNINNLREVNNSKFFETTYQDKYNSTGKNKKYFTNGNLSNRCNGNKVYVTNDARVVNNIFGTIMPLDKPSNPGMYKFDDIYSMDLPSTKYTGLKDIKLGNVQYYTDNNIEQDINRQLVINKSKVLKCNHTDPMGSRYASNNIISDTIDKNNLSDYQYHRDDLYRREEMMSRALNKIRQNDWDGKSCK